MQKNNKKTQLESQRDERTTHFQPITVQIHENEQQLKENENNMAQTVQARRGREADKQDCERKVIENEQRQFVRQPNDYIQGVNNRWISKQTWKISAMKNLSQLNQNITDIKMTSRKATQAKYQNEQLQRKS